MDKNAFIAETTKIIGRPPVGINSNNAWEFSGHSGVRWTPAKGDFPKITVTVGVASTRHCGKIPFVWIWCRGVDVYLKQSPKNFEKAYQALRDAYAMPG